LAGEKRKEEETKVGGKGFLYVWAALAKSLSKADNSTEIRG